MVLPFKIKNNIKVMTFNLKIKINNIITNNLEIRIQWRRGAEINKAETRLNYGGCNEQWCYWGLLGSIRAY